MSVTVNSIITNFNSYIGDTTTDRITAAERLQYVTEGVLWLQEELGNDLQNATYTLNYFDTVHYYKVTSALADLLDGSDLRREESYQTYSFAHKDSRELSEDIGQMSHESSWAIERRDDNNYLVVNHQSRFSAATIADCDSITSGGGTWAVDSSTSDATNLTIDSNEYKQGNASFNFDVTVAQSGNNRATLVNSTTLLNLSSYEDLASWIFWVYIPDVSFFSSITLYWGNSASAYWSATATTDFGGSAWVAGWNRVKIDWSAATATNSPTSSTISYLRIDYNYTSSQVNDTDFRLDDLKLIRPEKLTFHYLSWYVGASSIGTALLAFSATTDVPYFSGQYDQHKYAVAHKAAALCFQNLRLASEAQYENAEADRLLSRAKMIIPSSRNPQTKSFKVRGVSFVNHRRRRR